MHQLHLLAATCLAPPLMASSNTRTPRLVIFCCRSELRTLADSRSADEMPASQKPRISASPTAATSHQCVLSLATMCQVQEAGRVTEQRRSLEPMPPERLTARMQPPHDRLEELGRISFTQSGCTHLRRRPRSQCDRLA
jgi:hypothetical protein